MQTEEVLVTSPNSSEGSERPTIAGIKPVEIAISDPLKEETRKARLYLLGVGMVSIAIVWTGLVPTEINALGITFSEANRQALLRILALVVAYFLAAFAIYGAADFIRLRYAYLNELWAGVMSATQSAATREPPTSRPISELPETARKAMKSVERYTWLAVVLVLVRPIFEFLLPIVVGPYAIYALVSA